MSYVMIYVCKRQERNINIHQMGSSMLTAAEAPIPADAGKERVCYLFDYVIEGFVALHQRRKPSNGDHLESQRWEERWKARLTS